MIYDILDNLKSYTNIPHLKAILKFLKETDLFSLSEGDIEIKDKELYVKVLRYTPKDATVNNFETHKIYTDIQVFVDGMEKMQVANPKYLKKITEYDEKEDIQFFSSQNPISDIIISKNEFVVFFTGKAHKPGCFYQSLDRPVLKLVFKAKQTDK